MQHTYRLSISSTTEIFNKLILSTMLIESIKYLADEAEVELPDHIAHYDISMQLKLLDNLLTQRYPHEPLPARITEDIYKVLELQLKSKLYTLVSSIDFKFRLGNIKEHVDESNQANLAISKSTPNDSINAVDLDKTNFGDSGISLSPSDLDSHPIISTWNGDITTLTGVTAIVNAANSQLLGCFKPGHKCIDNVIHAAAGPNLRAYIAEEILQPRDYLPEETASAQITPAFNLPAEYVLHTVGPIVEDGIPSELDRISLQNAYLSCLRKLEQAPGNDKSIAFCCISTGVFGYPNDLACTAAVEAVLRYFEKRQSTITHVIFNTFLPIDDKSYRHALSTNPKLERIHENSLPLVPSCVLEAKDWLEKADYVIISAGAGLSASEGLDYLSTELVDMKYPILHQYGLKRLYSTIGFDWPSKLSYWQYFAHHVRTLDLWEEMPTYKRLLKFAKSKKGYFVHTSNADGLFRKHGFENVYTPQGSYHYIQCERFCREDCHRRFEPIDFTEDNIPKCEFCGGDMTMVLRGGSECNRAVFKEDRKKYKEFVAKVADANVVILEMGVGLNTPVVLRWPNEDAALSRPQTRLIRIGKGPSSTMSLDVLSSGKALVIDGDVLQVIKMLDD